MPVPLEKLDTLTPALIGCHCALGSVRPLAGYNHVYMAAAGGSSLLHWFRKSFTVEAAMKGEEGGECVRRKVAVT